MSIYPYDYEVNRLQTVKILREYCSLSVKEAVNISNKFLHRKEETKEWIEATMVSTKVTQLVDHLYHQGCISDDSTVVQILILRFLVDNNYKIVEVKNQ